MAYRETYYYRNFPDAPLATFVDKHTHKPSSCFFLSLAVALLLCLLLVPLSRAVPGGSTASGVLGLVMIVLFLGVAISGRFLIPRLSDRFDWAGKIARKQAGSTRETR